MGRSKNILVNLNRSFPALKIVIVVLVMLMVVTLGAIRGKQVTTKVANTGVEQGHDESFKVILGGEERDAVGLDKVEEEIDKKIEQAEEIDLTGKKLVALTFDDGPDAEVTRQILEVLAEKKVKVTFFMVGIMIQRTPETARAVAEAGHEVETHSMRHANLAAMSSEEMKADIDEAKAVLKTASGAEAEILRPPYGYVSETMRNELGMPMITWSVDPADWRDREAGLIKDRVVEASYDGAVVLLHDIYPSTAEAVGWMIDELRAQNFEFVTVKEMAEHKGVDLSAGQVYRDLAED